jgi:hypothetical protein
LGLAESLHKRIDGFGFFFRFVDPDPATCGKTAASLDSVLAGCA